MKKEQKSWGGVICAGFYGATPATATTSVSSLYEQHQGWLLSVGLCRSTVSKVHTLVNCSYILVFAHTVNIQTLTGGSLVIPLSLSDSGFAISMSWRHWVLDMAMPMSHNTQPLKTLSDPYTFTQGFLGFPHKLRVLCMLNIYSTTELHPS